MAAPIRNQNVFTAQVIIQRDFKTREDAESWAKMQEYSAKVMSKADATEVHIWE